MKSATEVVHNGIGLVEHLHAISQAQLNAAQAGNWDEVENLNQQRNELVEDLARLPELDPMDFKDTATAILDLDKQILALTNAAMTTVADQVGAITLKTKVSQEYRSFQIAS